MSARTSDLLGVLAMAVCALGIAAVQPRLSKEVAAVKLGDDATALPPPRQLRAMALGYRSAAADLLWAKLLVEQGVRSEQKRTFEGIRQYIDGIIELEPDHPTLYRFVDTLLIYKPGAVGTADDARAARAYLERGTRERPYDHEMWLHYGQFVAFLGPSFLSDNDEIQRWRKEGALAISQAVELGADADRTLSASTLLSKAGETKAAIQQLQNHYALTDNPDTRQQIRLKLEKLQGSVEVANAVGVVEGVWRDRYPFLTKGETLLVGPPRDPAHCAGPGSFQARECAADWTDATR